MGTSEIDLVQFRASGMYLATNSSTSYSIHGRLKISLTANGDLSKSLYPPAF